MSAAYGALITLAIGYAIIGVCWIIVVVCRRAQR